MRRLALDLQGVTANPELTIIHPEIEEILKRAKNDFDETLIFSWAFTERVLHGLKSLNIHNKFDRIIVREEEFIIDKSDDYWPYRFNRKYNLGTNCKDFNDIGNPREYVLIDDNTKFGYPIDRVIHIPKFTGQAYHFLIPYYEKALRKFD